MRIAFKGGDGTVAIMTLVDGADKEDAIKKFKDCHPNVYIDHFEFKGELPEGNFRDAWTLRGSEVVVDALKARSIHLDRVRNRRNLELEKLDREQLRFLSNPDIIRDIEGRKQILRELPKNVIGLEWPKLLEK